VAEAGTADGSAILPTVIRVATTSQLLASEDGSALSAYRALRAAILSGELPPGSPVSQVKLAAAYGISRAPLREGLRLLQNEGLVTAIHNRRMRVAPLTLEDLEELYALRLLTETLAVALSVPLLTDEELERARATNDAMHASIEADDVAAADAPHREFHLGLVAQAGQRMQAQVADLWDHAERYRSTLLEGPAVRVATHVQLSAAEHDAILEAAETRDGDLCAQGIAKQLTRVGLDVMATLDPTHDPRILRIAIREVAP
jgi:DNA-binding GntR family transcriptional regulator